MLQETTVLFKAENLVLEGLLFRAPGEKAVVVTHPHSLYGGNMHNPVVETVCRVYAEQGYTTLRFNFRGVGGSQGQFENGCGEMKDVAAALEYLRGAGFHTLHLAGYSFGSRVIAGIEELPDEVVAEIYIAPPVAFMDFSGVGARPKLRLVISSENDDIGPPAKVKEHLAHWNLLAKFAVIENGDHFFSTTGAELEKLLALEISNLGDLLPADGS